MRESERERARESERESERERERETGREREREREEREIEGEREQDMVRRELLIATSTFFTCGLLLQTGAQYSAAAVDTELP